jgi:riboflavin synthase, alpha subunit
MFTGIVQELGTVIRCDVHTTGVRLTVGCREVLADAQLGASIAVNGACLTAIQLAEESFSAEMAPETLRRTNLGDLREGSRVNLERPLAVTARLDGHFVLGHVDGTAELVSIESLGSDNWWLRIRVPDDLTRYIVSKGSLAVDGISLTVAAIDGGLVEFTIIPHTFRHTTLSGYRVGSRLNIEVDILAKHLEKLMSGRTGEASCF